MSLKSKLLIRISSHTDTFFSGESLAQEFAVSRAAVWKAIHALQNEGHAIESSSRGYRYLPDNDLLNPDIIRSCCPEISFPLYVFDSIDSTNNYAKSIASAADTHGTLVIANHQTAGRGRRGHTFFSPENCGLYLSLIIKPHSRVQEMLKITVAAAVAAVEAIQQTSHARPKIKWVNDILIDSKKTCGILTEASIDLESGGMDWAIMGIGFNVYEPEGGFPEELKSIAGPIAPRRQRDLRSRIAAAFLKNFHQVCADLESGGFAEEYKRRSFLIGQPITVIRGGSTRPATACGIDGECRLLVRYEDGSSEALSSGEVSVRPAS